MATTIPKPATIYQCCRVAPRATAASAVEQHLPLTFFDMCWLHFHPIQRLFFYQFPCSKHYFLETIVPNVKNSLSQTLQHYLPLAGNLLYPINSGIPQFRYVSGDSVSVTVAEANEASDFNYLTGNGARDADEFYPFVPELPEPEIEPDSGFKIIPLLAIQVTLFPGSGICIGFCNHHAIGDASSIVGFIKAWSFISKLGGNDGIFAENCCFPLYDRSVIKDPSGLVNIFWNGMKVHKIESLPVNLPTNKVRATYILHRKDIQNLRNLVLEKNPSLVHLSSFTLTTAYIWACLAKSAEKAGEEVVLNEPEHLAFAADARPRLNPPVPANYFGNCVACAKTELAHQKLKGDDGFLIAVELIGDVISNKVNNKDEILKDAELWLVEFGQLIGKRLFGVAGSPKFDVYESDFGWGKPKKYESISIDGDGAMTLCKSREFEGSLEIGLSLPKPKMDAFAIIFNDGLNM